MNTQINLRLPPKIINTARAYAKNHGFSTIQDFIKETVREKLFEQEFISNEELVLVNQLAEVSEKNNLYGTEEELFRNLRRK